MYYKLISKMVHFRIVTVAILCLAVPVVLYSIYWYAFAENLKEQGKKQTTKQLARNTRLVASLVAQINVPRWLEPSTLN